MNLVPDNCVWERPHVWVILLLNTDARARPRTDHLRSKGDPELLLAVRE